MIYFENVSFGYRKKKLLFQNMDMTLAPGHIYGLLGKNGAGKSSLLRLISGLLFPLDGSIRVGGHVPQHRLPSFLREIFYIPEEFDLPDTTISKYAAALSPFYPRYNEQQFRYYLAEFDVPFEHRLTSLSFGQMKKVLISFAMATNTRVLIMDEPTNGLDIPSKTTFRKLTASILDQERLILISTHQVRDLDNLIDAVIILDACNLILHHNLDSICEKLRFETHFESKEDIKVLYSEPSLQGYAVVMENPDKLDSRIDLERLFQAATKNPDRMKKIFL